MMRGNRPRRPEESGLQEGFIPRVGQVIHQEGDRLELADPMAMTRMHGLLFALVLELDQMVAHGR